MDRGRLGIIAALGTAQTLAWGSSYYLPAILADPIAHDLGISSTWFFAAFSTSADDKSSAPRMWFSQRASRCSEHRIRYG
jgi:hypothetical protein